MSTELRHAHETRCPPDVHGDPLALRRLGGCGRLNQVAAEG